MGARTQGREVALQVLYGLEAADADADAEAALRAHFRSFGGEPESRAWAERAVRGVCAERARLDELLAKSSEHWRVERMTRVDRNVLRLGAWELAARADVPRAIVLDEVVELAKKFGTESSGAFVNGVLDRVAEELGRVDTDR